MDSRKEYQIRRRVLADKLPSHSLAIIPAASESLRNGDAHYRFRQDSDFYYLTGFNEPDALLLITANPGSESFLFNLPKDLSKEQWTGMRLGQEAAPEILGVDKAYPLDNFPMRLVEFMAGRASIYYPISRYPALDNNIKQAWLLVKDQVRRGALAPESFHDLTPILSEMRLFKSGAELDLMREAARISVAAHQRAMRFCRQAEYEYQLEAELLYEFTREGCRSVAYDPIVASGDNACILHYTANDKPLRSGDLLLIDAGGEYKNYAADITRTYPVNGRFSAEQRQIYELVLRAQKAGIACIRPGCAWDKIQKTMVEILTVGLVDLGILQGHTEDLIESEAYKPFYMHQSGHWLGLDVHDSGRYKLEGEWRTLQPGMVLTVEPGLYFHPDLNCIDRRWRGIGVRIEDDVHVTADGHENLTHALAVEVEELEAMIRG
ncbi:Xaa-Pro aminopeptidase [Legionella septentrionalis]|uniref:Xaa-Pro aminopeptidase n=1 Tax=Legionella septentrionalis TaxID=2498109 RepID=A0A433JM21_9GAMM|nr:Xaa-Pro aminopeptidase [Legionella septentrionalis]RUQ91072.1 Xaa-Pro aminopeptidase [Legionella septentrionalis]